MNVDKQRDSKNSSSFSILKDNEKQTQTTISGPIKALKGGKS